MNTWYSLTNIRCSDSKEICAKACAGKDSPWFSGHFPGAPILPGIAQLGLVQETIQEAFNGKFIIKGIKRVRFRQIIRPGDPIKINVIDNNGDAKTCSFKIFVKDEIACTGTVFIEKQNIEQ